MSQQVDYEKLAELLIPKIGGQQNIIGLKHCMTRLRFILKDETIVNDEEVAKLDGVLQVVHGSGQYMVVIGTKVETAYRAIIDGGYLSLTDETGSKSEQKQARRRNVINSVAEVASSIFVPLLGIIMLSQLLRLLLTFLTGAEIIRSDSSTYTILSALAEATFYYMPILIGYTASLRFGLPPLEGIVIGAGILYPTLLANSTAAHGTFLGISLVMPSTGDYSSSVLPIIIAVAFAAWFERTVVEKVLPDSLKTFLRPFMTCTVTYLFILLVIGPVTTAFTYLLSSLFNWMEMTNGILFAALIGVIWQLVLVLGLQSAVFPIVLGNFASVGYDFTLSSTFGCNFSQLGAVLALRMRTKNQKTKDLCMPSMLSAFFGVIEPSLMGISLSRKRMFALTSLVNAFTGVGMTLMGLRVYQMTGFGILGFAGFVTEGQNTIRTLLLVAMWAAISAGLSFVLVYFFDREETA